MALGVMGISQASSFMEKLQLTLLEAELFIRGYSPADPGSVSEDRWKLMPFTKIEGVSDEDEDAYGPGATSWKWEEFSDWLEKESAAKRQKGNAPCSKPRVALLDWIPGPKTARIVLDGPNNESEKETLARWKAHSAVLWDALEVISGKNKTMYFHKQRFGSAVDRHLDKGRTRDKLELIIHRSKMRCAEPISDLRLKAKEIEEEIQELSQELADVEKRISFLKNHPRK